METLSCATVDVGGEVVVYNEYDTTHDVVYLFDLLGRAVEADYRGLVIEVRVGKSGVSSRTIVRY